MKYRKRPVVVDAEQWFPGREVAGVSFSLAEHPYVVTIHGQRAYIDPGDWVITESNGVNHYPCKPAEFERIYEPGE